MRLVDSLRSSDTPFAIYGAQVVAYGAYRAIQKLCGRSPEYFIVSDLDNNPKDIENICVCRLDVVPKDTFIIIGVTELLQMEIISGLQTQGYHNIFALTQHEEHLLMSEYFESIGIFPVASPIGKEELFDVDLLIYEVCNHNDKILHDHPVLRSFETTIQAGASMTGDRIAMLTDDIGENISKKNKQYCEMTATYWVWKNADHEWLGIEHYRRHIMVEPEMLTDKVDVILPLPYICYPNTITQFRRFVSDGVLRSLLDALRSLYPEKYDDYLKILYGPYQYTYNILCARKSVFHDYCQWFFGITRYMETMDVWVPEIKKTRALSYVAEVLTNLYFMSNADRLNILHVEKEIYV